VNHVAHEVGTEAPAYQQAVAAVSTLLYHFLGELDDKTAEDTLLLVVADQGRLNTDPDRIINLATYNELLRNIRRHAGGTPVRLTGSPRNVHLHLQDGTRGATRAALADLEARLYCRQAALSVNFFGD
jgi:predicted AlkP superfamily pyrophosphatase or phosphodiesterase